MVTQLVCHIPLPAGMLLIILLQAFEFFFVVVVHRSFVARAKDNFCFSAFAV